MILTIRTDKPEAELGLFNLMGEKIAYEKWEAHRQLSETIHHKIKQIIAAQGSALENVTAVVFYEGPGSFTGLRIGAAVANALGSGLGVPVASAGGEDWIDRGIKIIQRGDHQGALPFYSSEAKTTIQKK